MLPVEFYGRHVLQTRMRSHLVVVAAPVLDQSTGFLPRPEPLLVQTLIAKPTIEALIGAVLPRLARIVQCGSMSDVGHDPCTLHAVGGGTTRKQMTVWVGKKKSAQGGAFLLAFWRRRSPTNLPEDPHECLVYSWATSCSDHKGDHPTFGKGLRYELTPSISTSISQDDVAECVQ
jgi:hypothetical protein